MRFDSVQAAIDYVGRRAQENVRANRGGPFAALVLASDSLEIVAEGTNRVTSTNDPTAHAEVVAIREACAKRRSFQLHDCIVVTSCEPCPMCLGAVYWSRPQAIYYASTRADAAAIGFDDQLIYDEVVAPLQERKIPIHWLKSAACDRAFQDWVEKTDKVLY